MIRLCSSLEACQQSYVFSLDNCNLVGEAEGQIKCRFRDVDFQLQINETVRIAELII